jgi:ClpP class serine protease
MNYTRIVHAVFNSPWAIDRPWFGSIFSLLHSRVFAGEQSAGWFPAEAPPRQLGTHDDPLLLVGGLNAGGGRGRGGRFGVFRFGKRSDGRLINHSARIHAEAVRRCGGDAGTYYQIVREEEASLPAGQILHVFGSGVIGKHLSAMDEICSGGLSIDRIQESIRAGRDDDKVSAMMLQLDTPGGTVNGCTETAALLREAKKTKTIASFNDSLTASAGIWCTCCADVAYVTPSADAGSIGVYAAFMDYTEWCKKNGIAVDLITDGGKYKGAGYPGTSLTAEQRAKIQADVKASSDMFKADMRMGRPGISDETMQGQCFTGQAAVDAKLADELVLDLDAALADLAKTV